MTIFNARSRAKKRATEEQRKQAILGASGIEATDSLAAKTQAAEMAAMETYSMLGAPGTYDLPGDPTKTGEANPLGTSQGIFDTSGEGLSQRSGLATRMLAGKNIGTGDMIFKEGGAFEGSRQGILDPQAYAKQMSKSAAFRIQSRMTAEAEQLLAQKGPLWEQLENSTLGQIMEGAGVQMRETMRDLRNRAAKGGSARRAALNDANMILARERATQTRVQQTWQANLALFDTVRNYASKVQQENMRFIDGLPMIRQSYQNTLQQVTQLQLAAYDQASAMSMAGYEVRAAVGDLNILDQLVLGATNAVASYYTGSSVFGDVARPGAGGAGGESAGKSYAKKGGILGSLWGGAKSAVANTREAYLNQYGGEQYGQGGQGSLAGTSATNPAPSANWGGTGAVSGGFGKI